MPFTPKFVDLVKNSTTVQGTGAVTLGAALSGFSGFAAVCAPGDQFYYCLQGVDKPAEREVGRGTFQADGTISRDAALGGPFKNFSSGIKTIALVAAAEWYARLEAVASAPPSTGGSAAPSPLFSAAAGSTVAAPVVAVTTSGYSVNGVGEARYVQDAAVTAAYVTTNPRTSFRAADGRGFRLCAEQRLTAEMFGVIPNDSSTGAKSTNDAALRAACEFRPQVGSKYGATIHLGPLAYYIGVTLEPEGVFHLVGHGTGHVSGGNPGIGMTRLIAPTDVCTIRVRSGGTEGTGLSAGKIGANDSLIEGISIEQLTMGTNLLAHGVQIRGTTTIDRCLFVNIAGTGFYNYAQSGGGGAIEGATDEWRVINCEFHSCGGDGLYINGNEANAGYSLGCVFHQIGGTAILDRSYLPNSHYSPQITGYGAKGVHRSGKAWQLIQESIVGIEPGTNPGVWYALAPLASPTATFPAWDIATTYRAMLPFLIMNGSSMFGAYQEYGATIGQSSGLIVGGNTQATSGTNVVTTDLYSGLVSSRGVGSLRTDGGQGAGWPPYSHVGSSEQVSIGGRDDANGEDGRRTILRYQAAKDGGGISWGWAGDADSVLSTFGRTSWTLTGAGTATNFGRNAPVAGMLTLHSYAIAPTIGGADDAGYMSYARIHRGAVNGVPTAGYHAQGEFTWNLINPSNGILGWSCTASGTPGTWTPVPVTGFTGNYTGDTSFVGTGTFNGLLVNTANGYQLRIVGGGGSSGYIDVQKQGVGGSDLNLRGWGVNIWSDAGDGNFQQIAGFAQGGVNFYKNSAVTGTLDASGAIKQAGNQVWHAGNLTQFASAVAGFVPSSGGGTANFLRADGSWAVPPSGSGTVTSASVVTANGISGTVATASTTPAITLSLGAITPASVAAVGAMTGSNLSGTNTGDQTISLTGDVTGSGTSSFVATIGANKVGFAKFVAASAASLVGATAAGNFAELTPASARGVLGLAAVATSGSASDLASGTLPVAATAALTGDVTKAAGASATTIAANSVTFAKFVAASQAAFVGATAAGNFGELTPAAATAQLSAMVGANGTVAGTKGLVPAPAATDNVKLLRGDGTWVAANAGTVTSASVTTANGVSGTVATATTTPAITLTLGAITPTSVAATGAITSSGGGIGYATGAGGTVAQATSRTTGVTLSKLSGAITLFSATTTAGQTTTLTVTNSQVAATDTVVVSQASGTGIYFCAVSKVLAGSFNLSVYTPAAVGTAEAPLLNFAVVKAVTA